MVAERLSDYFLVRMVVWRYDLSCELTAEPFVADVTPTSLTVLDPHLSALTFKLDGGPKPLRSWSYGHDEVHLLIPRYPEDEEGYEGESRILTRSAEFLGFALCKERRGIDVCQTTRERRRVVVKDMMSDDTFDVAVHPELAELMAQQPED